MKAKITVVVILSLWASLATGKEPTRIYAMPALIQGSQTPDQIPDSAAWRIFLGAKAEAVSAAGHSEGFQAYLTFLKNELQPNDLAIFQSVLEAYGARAASLWNGYNDQVEAVQTGSPVVNYQYNLQVSLAQQVQEERNTLQSQMTAKGYSWLTAFVQGEKRHMTISSTDFSLVATRINPRPKLVLASMKMSMPQGTQMGASYSSYGSMWISISGWDSNYNPSGTFYAQVGTEGTTNPCTGPCINATHTPKVTYIHKGSNYNVTGNGVRPYNYINYYNTWSFPFSPTDFQWDSEYALGQIICSIAGNFFGNNPFPSGPTGSMQVEIATSYTSLQSGWYTCPTYPTCNQTWQPLTLQCDNNPGPPDFVPTYASLPLGYQVSVIEIQQVAPCDRPSASAKWNCVAPGTDTWTTTFPNPFPATYGAPPVMKLCTQHP